MTIQPTESLKTTQEWRSDGKSTGGESQIILNIKWRLNNSENYGFRAEGNAIDPDNVNIVIIHTNWKVEEEIKLVKEQAIPLSSEPWTMPSKKETLLRTAVVSQCFSSS